MFLQENDSYSDVLYSILYPKLERNKLFVKSSCIDFVFYGEIGCGWKGMSKALNFRLKPPRSSRQMLMPRLDYL